jgi:hypothetical protein
MFFNFCQLGLTLQALGFSVTIYCVNPAFFGQFFAPRQNSKNTGSLPQPFRETKYFVNVVAALDTSASGSKLPCGGAAPYIAALGGLTPIWMTAASPERTHRPWFEYAIADLRREIREVMRCAELNRPRNRRGLSWILPTSFEGYVWAFPTNVSP